MKQKISILFLIIGLGIGYALWDLHGEPETVSAQTIENFTFETLDGQKKALYDLKGKTILINFWATWCPPCIKEFPDLLTVAKDNPDDVILLAVSVDQTKEVIRTFQKRFSKEIQSQMALPNVIIAHDPTLKIAQDQFKVQKFPETFILNPDYTLKKRIIGIFTPDIIDIE